MNELNNRVRGKATAVATLCIWITGAAVAQLFPVVEAATPPGTLYYQFAVELSLLLLMVKFLMPETKGRTIEEIERSWVRHEGEKLARSPEA